MTELLDSGAIFFKHILHPKVSFFFLYATRGLGVGVALCMYIFAAMWMGDTLWSRPGVAKIGSMAYEKGVSNGSTNCIVRGRQAKHSE